MMRSHGVDLGATFAPFCLGLLSLTLPAGGSSCKSLTSCSGPHCHSLSMEKEMSSHQPHYAANLGARL